MPCTVRRRRQADEWNFAFAEHKPSPRSRTGTSALR
jgi:hypothetical protein